MRNNSVADVYEWVMQDVLTKVQELFVREGVESSVQEELRALWSSKLKEANVVGLEENQGRHSVAHTESSQQCIQGRNKAPIATAVPTKLCVGGTPSQEAAIKNGIGIPTGFPSRMANPQGGSVVLGVPQPGTQYYGPQGMGQISLPSGTMLTQRRFYDSRLVHLPYLSVQAVGARGPGIQGPPGALSAGPGMAVPGIPMKPQGLYAEGGKEVGQIGFIEGSVSMTQSTGGSGDRTGTSSSGVFNSGCGNPTLPTIPGCKGPGKRKLLDDAHNSNRTANGPHCDDATPQPAAKTQRTNVTAVSNEKTADRNDTGVVKDGKFDKIMGNDDDDPPLSDDDEDDVDPPNYLTAQYEKVSRTKNRWRCQLKYGIFHANGKDYLFKNATGDFTF